MLDDLEIFLENMLMRTKLVEMARIGQWRQFLLLQVI